jgi:hypothetical protein
MVILFLYDTRISASHSQTLNSKGLHLIRIHYLSNEFLRESLSVVAAKAHEKRQCETTGIEGRRTSDHSSLNIPFHPS